MATTGEAVGRVDARRVAGTVMLAGGALVDDLAADSSIGTAVLAGDVDIAGDTLAHGAGRRLPAFCLRGTVDVGAHVR